MAVLVREASPALVVKVPTGSLTVWSTLGLLVFSTILTTVEFFVNVATSVTVSTSLAAVDIIVLAVVALDTVVTVVLGVKSTKAVAVELTGENVAFWRAGVVCCGVVFSVGVNVLFDKAALCPAVPSDRVTATLGELVRRTGRAVEDRVRWVVANEAVVCG